ncbi:hypothetical protein BVC80_8931g25 [Macleaya cordata]|uniref:Uncharacterized protein n=1 Tax=Macleaya cordata TaxID=56857 RepID=A0A200R8A2_MACCD|nr:hypothetical protein BVC80_8931g25 [Macleaya cordata]
MKDRGKAVAVSSSNWFSDYSSLSDLPCRKHPSSSSAGGICAYCLKDRLIKLVCSDCGEQRLSSCSCSDISSSYTAAEVGSVGRISFLIENEKEDIPHSNTTKPIRSESTVLLKRSSSSSVDVKKSGFWKFGRFFRKKREKGSLEFSGTNNGGGFDEKGEMWVFHNVGVSRSRSVGGFRGGFDDSEGGFRVSSGGASELNRDGHTESAKRSGGFNGVESILGGSSGGKIGGLLESESGFGGLKKDDPSLFPESGFKGVRKGGMMELDGGFNGVDESGFIDLKLGFSSESKPEFSCLKHGDLFETESGFRISRDGDFSEHESDSFSYLRGERIFSNGGSCRITVNDTEIKKCKKSLKVWRWIFKNHSGTGRTVCKKHEEHVIKS